jgi:hypothetical protein
VFSSGEDFCPDDSFGLVITVGSLMVNGPGGESALKRNAPARTVMAMAAVIKAVKRLLDVHENVEPPGVVGSFLSRLLR